MARFHLAASGLARDRWSEPMQYFQFEIWFGIPDTLDPALKTLKASFITLPLPAKHPHIANSACSLLQALCQSSGPPPTQPQQSLGRRRSRTGKSFTGVKRLLLLAESRGFTSIILFTASVLFLSFMSSMLFV